MHLLMAGRAHFLVPKKKRPLAGADMVRAADPQACRDKGTKIWLSTPPLQLSKTSYLCPDMVSRAHLDNGVAALATLWGIQPNDVAERLAIKLDFSHVEPKPLAKEPGALSGMKTPSTPLSNCLLPVGHWLPS